MTTHQLQHSQHPLDPLSVEEIQIASKVVAKYAEKQITRLVFNSIILDEPTKEEVLAFDSGKTKTLQRHALVVVMDSARTKTYEAIVDLKLQQVASWRFVPRAQPPLTPDDCHRAEAIAKQSPEVIAELKKRGVVNMELVTIDPWSVSYFGESDHEGRRLMQCFMYTRNFPGDSHYAHPIDFVPVVDLNEGRLYKIDFPPGPSVPVPSKPHNYAAQFMNPNEFRKGLKPLEILQSEGPSFAVEGNLIQWQNWSLRIGYNYREGLVLYNIVFNDKGTPRHVLYRASLVEMTVPYGDPTPPYHRKVAFDVGDYGLGFCCSSLELGCDCLGQIHYFDAILNNNKGEAVVIKKAVCLHEEDDGLMWKHVEYRTGESESRRSRRLVISFVATVVNYEYAFYWYLYQDGKIEFTIKATGILSTHAIGHNEQPKNGILVGNGVNAPLHQHMFNVRLDMMVDGIKNSVIETEVKSMAEDEHNPFLNGFVTKKTVLKTEKEAQRKNKPLTGRSWVVVNPSKINQNSQLPVGYKLVPVASPLILAGPKSWIAKRAAFATKHLWVTPFNRTEKYPAGDYPNQDPGTDGLAVWTRADRSIENTDVVVWHSFGLIHVPRIEDYPVMPVESTGFMLKPVNFFLENPSIDLPPTKSLLSKDNTCGVSACQKKEHSKL